MNNILELRGFFGYWFGDTVYLITDKDQIPRMIIEINIKPSGLVYFCVVGGTEVSFHYYFELSTEINLKLKTEN